MTWGGFKGDCGRFWGKCGRCWVNWGQDHLGEVVRVTRRNLGVTGGGLMMTMGGFKGD